MLTVIAICLIIAATGTAWLKALAPKHKPAGSQSALVVSAGGAQCGTLVTVSDHIALKVGTAAPTPIPSGATVTLVGSCP